MTKDEALDLAQKALEDVCGNRCNAEYNPCFQREAINAIKAAKEAKGEPVAWSEEIIDDLHALYDSEMIKENDSGDALIRLDEAVCVVEEVAQRNTTPPKQEAKDEPAAWAPYLSDRADGVQGHYAIARWNPRGYREVWNLRRHMWGAFSDDVMSLEEADYLLQKITIPTRKPAPPAQPVIDESAAKRIATALGWEPKRKPLTDEEINDVVSSLTVSNKGVIYFSANLLDFARAIEAAHGITGENNG